MTQSNVTSQSAQWFLLFRISHFSYSPFVIKTTEVGHGLGWANIVLTAEIAPPGNQIHFRFLFLGHMGELCYFPACFAIRWNHVTWWAMDENGMAISNHGP